MYSFPALAGLLGMQTHSKMDNVPFSSPCGATVKDVQNLHAPTFAQFWGIVNGHDLLDVGYIAFLSPYPFTAPPVTPST